MTDSLRPIADPQLDLVLQRVVDITPEEAFAAWTTPELLKPWFTPAPWQTVGCEIDLRSGGQFRTVMRGPDGTEMDNTGCVLDVVPNRRFAWTGALGPGYRPRTNAVAAAVPFLFSAVLTFEPQDGGTLYTATGIHADEAGRERHAQMGFHAGWGVALDQLVAFMKSRR